jgi:hypothetical protein
LKVRKASKQPFYTVMLKSIFNVQHERIAVNLDTAPQIQDFALCCIAGNRASAQYGKAQIANLVLYQGRKHLLLN